MTETASNEGLWCEGKSGSGKVGEESEAGVANGGHES